MLNKVIKNIKKQEKKKGKDSGLPDLNPPKKKHRSDQGFHAKANSEAGALRQRSMGNRMWKTNNKPK